MQGYNPELCQAVTEKGNQCRRKPNYGKFCAVHKDQDVTIAYQKHIADQKVHDFDVALLDRTDLIQLELDIAANNKHVERQPYNQQPFYDSDIEIESEGTGICDFCGEETFVLACNTAEVFCIDRDCMDKSIATRRGFSGRINVFYQLQDRRRAQKRVVDILKEEAEKLMGPQPLGDIFKQIVQFMI